MFWITSYSAVGLVRYHHVHSDLTTSWMVSAHVMTKTQLKHWLLGLFSLSTRFDE
jgi:hypothetical protein